MGILKRLLAKQKSRSDISKAKHRLSVSLHQGSFYSYLSVRRNLHVNLQHNVTTPHLVTTTCQCVIYVCFSSSSFPARTLGVLVSALTKTNSYQYLLACNNLCINPFSDHLTDLCLDSTTCQSIKSVFYVKPFYFLITAHQLCETLFSYHYPSVV